MPSFIFNLDFVFRFFYTAAKPGETLMSIRQHLAPEELHKLYLDQQLTIEAIATRFGCSASTIRRRLKELAVPIRPRGSQIRRKWESRWSPELAYVVGLMATDGNLSKDGRHLALGSKDQELLETLRDCLSIENSISRTANGKGSYYYRLQWGDRSFYNWLLSIGLVPAKSLRLGPLVIPDEYFADFVRGCLDGDGSVNVYTDRYNVFKSETYVYTRLFVTIVSASFPFLAWLQNNIARLIGVQGGLFAKKSRQGHSPCWDLKYAKHASIRLLEWIYYAPDVPCLARKRDEARFFLRKSEGP